jgi:hypothetical protein
VCRGLDEHRVGRIGARQIAVGDGHDLRTGEFLVADEPAGASAEADEGKPDAIIHAGLPGPTEHAGRDNDGQA